MKVNYLSMLFALSLLCACNLAVAQGTSLTLCGVADNSPLDLNPLPGIVQVNCNLGTGTFVGSATQTVLNNYDSINIVGAFTGSGSLNVSNNYNFGSWVGHGYEWVRLNGTLTNPTGLTTGNESLQGSTTASTFNNNSAIEAVSPVAGLQTPWAFNVKDTNWGDFSGPGLLTGNFQWNADGGSFNFQHSGQFTIAVPELGTLPALAVYGLGGSVMVLRRRLMRA